jgi:hypothetical protein
MKFGIELEVVGVTASEATAALVNEGIPCQDAGYTHTVMEQWKVVSDSSISGPGSDCGACEIVSPPMELDSGCAELLKVCRILNELGADVNSTCGTHVHIEVKNETAATIGNIFNRYKAFETQIDCFMPQSRRGTRSGYCRSLADIDDMNFPSIQAVRDCDNFRFLKVNLKSFRKYGTIEFRQHSGSLNGPKLSRWVHFLAEFVIASRRETAVVGTRPQSQEEIIARLPYKKLEIFRMVRFNSVTTSQLSERMGYSSNSRTNTVLRQLRALGLQIIVKPRSRVLEYVDQSQAAEVIAETDTLWTGISSDLKAYFHRRAAVLA